MTPNGYLKNNLLSKKKRIVSGYFIYELFNTDIELLAMWQCNV